MSGRIEVETSSVVVLPPPLCGKPQAFVRIAVVMPSQRVAPQRASVLPKAVNDRPVGLRTAGTSIGRSESARNSLPNRP